MTSLADRIRASREEWVEAGAYKFNVRRPTALKLTRYAGLNDLSPVLLEFVVDWNVPESELVPGGGGKVPQFEQEAFLEWVGDRPAVVNELAEKVLAIINRHFAAEQAAEKNS